MKIKETQTTNLNKTVFMKELLGVIDTYEEKFGVRPQTIRMRAPFYDGVQAEFEIMTGNRSGLRTVQGVEIEKVALIYKHDLEVL